MRVVSLIVVISSFKSSKLISDATYYFHVRKRRFEGRIKLKHDFVKHTHHMAVTCIALPQN